MLTKIKKLFKRTLALLVVFSLIFGGYSLIPAINSIHAVDSYGPGLKLLSMQTGTASSGFSTNVKTVGFGETVYFYMEVQNTNVPSVAENMNVKVFLPDYLSGGVVTSATVTTTTPAAGVAGQTTDTKSILTNLNASDLRLVYKSGSTTVTGDMNNDGTKEFNNTVMPDGITEGGLNLGTLVGGANTIQVSFQATVQRDGQPNLTVKYLGMNVTKNTQWTDSTSADPGDTVKGYIEIHNPNVPSTAKNVQVRIDVPGTTGTVTSTAFAQADNVAQVTDPTAFVLSSGTLKLVTGSAVITWDQNGDGVKEYNASGISDNIFTTGLNLGDQHGCNNYVIQISFQAVVQPAGAPAAAAAPAAAQTTQAAAIPAAPATVTKKPAQLPSTGPEALGMIFSIGMIPLGYVLRKIKP